MKIDAGRNNGVTCGIAPTSVFENHYGTSTSTDYTFARDNLGSYGYQFSNSGSKKVTGTSGGNASSYGTNWSVDDIIGVVDTINMTELPFEIEQQLRKQHINVTARQVSEPLSDNLTVKVEYTWSPRRNCHFIYAGLFTSYGLSDVDEIVDYISLVGENYATAQN